MNKRVLLTVALLLAFWPMLVGAESSQLTTSEEEISAFEKVFGSGPQEEDVYRADRLLVSATGSQIPVRLAPSVATVITKEEIKEIGATTLDEILETVPGLHTLPSGLNIFSSIWSIRGIHTKINPQVLLLIDGTPLTRPYDGGRPNALRIPVAMISRVEVIRGPGSAVHGADAFAGVINIITKDNFEIDGTEVGARYGSFETYDGWLQHGGQYAGWDIWGSFEVQASDGDKNRVVAQDYLHGVGAGAFSNAPGYLDTDYYSNQTHFGVRKGNFNFNLYGNWSDDDSGMGPSALQIVDYTSKINSEVWLAAFEYRDRKFAPNWDLGLRLHAAYLKVDNYFMLLPEDLLNLWGFPGVNNDMIGNPIGVSKYGGPEFTAFYEGINNHKIRMSTGLTFTDTDTESYQNFGATIANPYNALQYVGPDSPDIYMKPQNRSLWFASLQDEWSLAKGWTFTGGVRFDEYSDFGSTINPRAALVWETTAELTSKLMYGSAFRAPSFSEQYVQNNNLITGNTDLQPETIDTYELAFEWQPNYDLTTSLNLFYYQAEDLVEYVGSPPPAAPAENYAKQQGHGVEIELNWHPHKSLRVRSNFAFQRSKNKTTNSLVHDAPEMQFYLNPHWIFMEDWSLDSQFYWIADRHRQQDDPRADIADYELVNLTLRRTNIVNHWDVAVAVRNLFDEDAREPSPYDAAAPEGAYMPNDYPLESRAIWAELSCHF